MRSKLPPLMVSLPGLPLARRMGGQLLHVAGCASASATESDRTAQRQYGIRQGVRAHLSEPCLLSDRMTNRARYF